MSLNKLAKWIKIITTYYIKFRKFVGNNRNCYKQKINS